MPLFEESDATSETASLSSSLESDTHYNLIDVKNWLEYNYRSYRRTRKAIKVEKEESEDKNKVEIELDITSEPDYSSGFDVSTSIDEDEKFSYRKLEDISYSILEKTDILEEENHTRYDIHNCVDEDKLIVALGIRYVLTDELPVNWIPSLLIDIILEGAAYCATDPLIPHPDFYRDLYLIKKKSRNRGATTSRTSQNILSVEHLIITGLAKYREQDRLEELATSYPSRIVTVRGTTTSERKILQ